MRKLHHKPAAYDFPWNVLRLLLFGQLHVIEGHTNGAAAVLPCHMPALMTLSSRWRHANAQLARHAVPLNDHALNRLTILVLTETKALADGLAQRHGKHWRRSPTGDTPRNGDAITSA